MTEILEIFSTRELASLFWLVIILIAIYINPSIRKSLRHVLKSFFNKKIQVPLFFLFLYMCLITYILYKIKLWELSLLKDTILWFLFSALVLFFNANTDEKGYFKRVIFDNLKFIIIIEFLINFYVFSFFTEIVIIPVITIFVTLQTYANHPLRKDKNKQVATCLNNIMAFVGFCLISYVLYKTFNSNDKILTIINYKSLLLPPVYTFATLPFFFLLALYISYENIFRRLPFILEDKSTTRRLKTLILIYANISLKKVRKLNRELNWEINNYNFKNYIKEVLNN